MTQNPPEPVAPDADITTPSDEELAAAKRAKAETIGRYVAMFLMPVLMVGMMITGYLAAMHNPQPHHLPIAVVASDAPRAQSFADALSGTEGDAVQTRVVATAEEAKQQVIDREVPGAVVLGEGKATLYTASAAGASQVSVVAQLVAPTAAAEHLVVTPEDLVPLPGNDPAGLGAMFLATALVMAGYLPLSIMLSNAPNLLRFRRFVPLLAGWSVLIAGLVWLVTGPILGVVQPAQAWPVFGVAVLGVFAIGAVQLFLTRILGPMAVLAAMFFLMVLGVPASNMSISMYTAPPFYTVLHGILPTPAIGEAMRSVMYFDGHGAWPHLLVLIIGAAAGLAATLIIDAVKKAKNPHPGPVVVNMPSLHGGKRPVTRFWRGFQLLLFPLLMVTMMIAAMLGAMHSPAPRDMPVAVVGPSVEQAQRTATSLEDSMPGMFELRAMDSAQDAREMVQDRELVGAFVLPGEASPEAQVITNQAAGSSAAQTVDRVFTQVAQAQKMQVSADDVAPLPERDSMGTVSMYVAMGWILAGFMIIVVGANAAPASRPLPKLLPIVAAYALGMSALIWLIADPITGAVDGHFWQLFGTGAIAIFCVAMFATVFERLIGLLAILPVVGILMFLGVPASGGAVSVYMEPEVFLGLEHVLPMGAGVEAVRSILYFGSDTLGVSLLTFAAWGVVSLLVVAVIDRFKTVRTTIEHITVHVYDVPARHLVDGSATSEAAAAAEPAAVAEDADAPESERDAQALPTA